MSRYKKILPSFFFSFLFFNFTPSYSQLSIVSTAVNEFNVTPSSLCRVNIMNALTKEADAFLEARIFNSNNDLLLSVKTNPFRLKTGLNSGASLNISILSAVYSLLPQAEYIKTHQSLSSGSYKYCYILTPLGNVETGDELCDDVLSEINSFLILVYPGDKDTIETTHLVLIWNHSEPFNVLAPGDFFRMAVVELSSDQSAESGVTANPPLFQKTFLTTHNVQYPFDSPELKKGKRYGWQVQKISNGNSIAQTEAWEFVIEPEKVIKYNKYAVMKKTVDGGFYTVENNKLFFRFDEEYNASQDVKCVIYDYQRQAVKPKVKNDSKEKKSNSSSISLKNNGYNGFEINMDELDVKTGYYTLEVQNEKNETFLLKFYVR